MHKDSKDVLLIKNEQHKKTEMKYADLIYITYIAPSDFLSPVINNINIRFFF